MQTGEVQNPLLDVLGPEPGFNPLIQSGESFPFGLDLELSQGLFKGHQGSVQRYLRFSGVDSVLALSQRF